MEEGYNNIDDQQLLNDFRSRLTQLLSEDLQASSAKQRIESSAFEDKEGLSPDEQEHPKIEEEHGSNKFLLRDIKNLLLQIDSVQTQKSLSIPEKQEKQAKVVKEEKNEDDKEIQLDKLKEMTKALENDYDLLKEKDLAQYFRSKNVTAPSQKSALSSIEEDVILCYLYQRQEQIINKIGSLQSKVNNRFKEREYESNQIQYNVQEQLSQVKKQYIPIAKFYQQQNTSFQSSKNSSLRQSLKSLSNTSGTDIYKTFLAGRLLQYYDKNEIVKEIYQQKFGPYPISSIGHAYIDDLEALIVKGPDSLVSFVNPLNFTIIRSLELPKHLTSNVRWVIDIGRFFILQIENQYGDILYFDEMNYVHKWSFGQPIVKPLIITHLDKIYAIVSTVSGDLTLFEFESQVKPTFKFHSSYSLRTDLKQDDSTSSSVSKNNVFFIKKLKETELIAIGQKEGGITFIELNLQKLRLTKYKPFLSIENLGRQSVKDAVELKKDKILVMIQSPPEYYIIDFESQQVSHLVGGGYGKAGYSMTLLPVYDYDSYPYVLCKEQDSISILDPLKNKMSQIVRYDSKDSKHDLTENEDNVIFDSISSNVFYASKKEGDSYSLMKYEISPQLLESIKY